MAKAGRKRKQGKRERNGRLSRVGEERIVKGNDRAQLMQELYGQDGSDAIGRAYRMGLLGQGTEAKAMLDMGRAIFNAYWSTYSHGRIKSTLGGTSAGNDNDGSLARERWLRTQLDAVRAMGEHIRKPLYQLVIDINPDCGPDWLDRMIACIIDRTPKLIDKGDTQRMDYARLALEALTAPNFRPAPRSEPTGRVLAVG